jgi:hypothetical protein
MAMAPDGRQVAVSGRRSREQGVWLVDLDSGSMLLAWLSCRLACGYGDAFG